MSETATARSTDELPEFPQPESPEFFTAGQLADRWQVDRETVYRWSGDRLPVMKLGPRTSRYRRDHVLKLERELLGEN